MDKQRPEDPFSSAVAAFDEARVVELIKACNPLIPMDVYMVYGAADRQAGVVSLTSSSNKQLVGKNARDVID